MELLHLRVTFFSVPLTKTLQPLLVFLLFPLVELHDPLHGCMEPTNRLHLNLRKSMFKLSLEVCLRLRFGFNILTTERRIVSVGLCGLFHMPQGPRDLLEF